MASESDEHRARGAQIHQHHDGSLSIAQARVLRALNCGGTLTKKQIEVAAGLTRWKTRQTVTELTRRDLIFDSARLDRYEITRLGRNTLAAQASDFGRLEAEHGRATGPDSR
ncbi:MULTISPECIES: hypothetical protein [Nocardia]|uniref:hypothetical protein n=1 Tax=Nocardia TaxID=1817 RepID=UPI0012FA945F|nr:MULTISPECIES: hypothetical protein [Nocardia]